MLKTVIVFLSSLCFIFAEDFDLSRYEKSLYSQNGEDGILCQIFKLIKPHYRYCVELGASDGVSNSNTYLLRLQGWDSLSLSKSYHDPDINLYREFISAENINQLLKTYEVPTDFDLLSIDLDYNDFYIWDAIDSSYKPRVVVIAYNATHLPHEDKIVRYDPLFSGDETYYFGASLLALYNLGKAKGYSLVYAEKAGMNLFFIRSDILETKQLKFKDMNDVEKIYRSNVNQKGIRRKDPKNRSHLTSSDIIVTRGMPKLNGTF